MGGGGAVKTGFSTDLIPHKTGMRGPQQTTTKQQHIEQMNLLLNESYLHTCLAFLFNHMRGIHWRI
jgi:hypothetical protein